jgi:hypothetical protein
MPFPNWIYLTMGENINYFKVGDIKMKTIGKSARKVPYGPMNLQKFAHFYVLSAHYMALLRAI